MDEKTVIVEYRTQKDCCGCCSQKLEKPQISNSKVFRFSKDNCLEWLSQEDWKTEAEFDDELNRIIQDFVYETISFFSTSSDEKILIDNNEFEKVKTLVLEEVC